MAESKNTEGRWRVDHNHSHYVVCDHPPMVVSIHGRSLTAASREAKARLIAAAPEMYEALLQAREWLRGWASAEQQLALIDSALSKASSLSEEDASHV